MFDGSVHPKDLCKVFEYLPCYRSCLSSLGGLAVGPSGLSSHSQVKLMVAGGLAGAAAKTCTAPLGRLTILYQVNSFEGPQPTVWQGLRQIVKAQVLSWLPMHTVALAKNVPERSAVSSSLPQMIYPNMVLYLATLRYTNVEAQHRPE
jgi:hypothetical protein